MAGRKLDFFAVFVILVLGIGFSISNVDAQGTNPVGIPSSPLAWTFDNVITDCNTIKNPDGPNLCFFLTNEFVCVREFSGNKAGCPLVMIVAPTNRSRTVYSFRITGPLTDGRARWAGVGLKRSDLPSVSRMDNALVFACIRGRHQGKDVLRFELFYTLEADVVPLPNEQEVLRAMQGSFKIAIVDDRIFCEFNLPRKLTVTRPPQSVHKGAVEIDLRFNFFHILVANGEYKIEDVHKPFRQHPDRGSRRYIELARLRKSSCGLRKACLGKGVDGCKDIGNCHVITKIFPHCLNYIDSDNNPTPENTGRCATTSDFAGLDIELETEKGNVVLVGFGDTNEIRFKLYRVLFFLSCERATRTSPPEVVIRVNSCNPTSKSSICNANIPENPLIPNLLTTLKNLISEVEFDINGNPKMADGWLTCSFRFDVSSPIWSNIDPTFPLINYTHGKYYTALGETDPAIGGGWAVPSIRIPELVVTRVAAPLLDISRSDFQLDHVPEVPDTRKPNSLNPKDPTDAASNVRMSDFFIIFATTFSICTFTPWGYFL